MYYEALDDDGEYHLYPIREGKWERIAGVPPLYEYHEWNSSLGDKESQLEFFSPAKIRLFTEKLAKNHTSNDGREDYVTLKAEKKKKACRSSE